VAIAIRGSTPATATDNGGSATVSLTLSGARQPQVNDILLIIHCNDFYAASNMPTPTVGGSTAGVTAITNGTADAGTNGAHAKAYWWLNSGAADRTVSVTETGSHDEEKALAVYVLSGVDTSTPIDVAGNTFNASTGPSWVLTAVSPTSSDAYLIAHVNTGGGNSGGGSVTPPGTMTEQYDVNVGGITYEGATQQLATSGSTGTRTFTPAADAGFAGLLIAMKTASAAAVSAPPSRRSQMGAYLSGL
jgi:hypothetical protein